ncbi:MAG: hypothetical protein L3K17_09775 [Thermoplasmata archaeon]|nr:hypothetical protein [Thermoplasmata archaeon]
MRKASVPHGSDSRYTRRRRLAVGGAVHALAFIAVVVLWAPSAMGSIVPLTTIKAPYTTAVVSLANPKAVSGCGTAKLVTKAFFNTTSGIGGFSSRANSTWCTKSTNNSALEEGKITINIPISVKTTGLHNITVVWETHAVGSVNVTAGRCAGSATNASSTCTRLAEAFVFGTNYLLDNTTKTRTISTAPLWPGNFTAVWSNTTCSLTTCTTSASAAKTSALHTGKAFWSWDWSSVSMNASHSYMLHFVLYGGVWATLLTTGGATLTGAKVNGQFNSGTLGNEQDLLSISVV